MTPTVIGRSQVLSNALLQAAWITIRDPAAIATGINSHLKSLSSSLSPAINVRGSGERTLVSGNSFSSVAWDLRADHPSVGA
jgi:hypothetical protein